MIKQSMLKITHNAGFFSCCTIRLHRIIEFFNTYKKCPEIVDSSEQFEWYKSGQNCDITFDFFKNYCDFKNIEYTKYINNMYEPEENQYFDYKKLNYEELSRFVKKYFTPTDKIVSIVQEIEVKYNINYEKLCVVFHRGNLKSREVNVPTYDDYFYKINQILNENPDITFLFQSDEYEFLGTMSQKYPNSIILSSHIRCIKSNNVTDIDIIDRRNNYEFSQKYLAITIVMSKCKYVICGSGNCSLWIALYRGNAVGFYQHLNPLKSQPKLDYWV